MAEAPDAATAWRWLLERKPGTRGFHDGETLFALVAAAHARPRLRALYPFPTHGTLKFLRSGPPFDGGDRDMPYVITAGPPYKVCTVHGGALGGGATLEEAVSLVVAHLPADL
ncbi:DUF6193 family natural product biosynthesis protein [Streptomyces sp. NPDC058964]|uniref:DUF6193 family natural product biosynthesis protein n=1 Tax=Streptomyces sp. NPDC058964 TaxID=3346681 RepID=UPI0036B50263